MYAELFKSLKVCQKEEKFSKSQEKLKYSSTWSDGPFCLGTHLPAWMAGWGWFAK